jgi:hypothetical protein
MKWLLKGKPFEVQAEALRRSAGKRGWGHGLEMGLGKTAVALNEYLELWYAKAVDVCLVFCPFTLTGTWGEQIDTWASEHNCKVWTWPNIPKHPYQDGVPNIYVVYYEAISVGGKTGQDLTQWLLDNHRTMLVVEESIEVKNHGAVRSQYLIARGPEFELVRNLCGWPIVKGPHDMWSQFRILGADDIGNFFQFRNRYCKMGGFKGKQIIGTREDREAEFTELLQQWYWLAAKKDWAKDLPAKMYLPPRYIKMSDVQIKHYKSMLQNFIVMLDSAMVTAPMVSTQHNKLQQIASGFIYDEQRGVNWITKEPSKAVELVSMLEQNTHSKVLVFCNFRPTIAMLNEYLRKHGIKTSVLAGKTTMAELGLDFDKEKRTFNSDDETQVALCQSASTKYGLTLLGTEARPCYTTLYYENSQDLNARIQSEDRNHRHGQKFPVGYTDFVSSPVEKKIVTALIEDRDRAASLLTPKSKQDIRILREALSQSIKML